MMEISGVRVIHYSRVSRIIANRRRIKKLTPNKAKQPLRKD